MYGQFLHAYGIPEFLQHLAAEFIRVSVLALAKGVLTHLPRVPHAQFQQCQTVTLHRDTELRAVDFHIGKERHQHFSRECAELGLHFRHEGAEHGGILLLDIEPEAQVERLYYASSPNPEEVAESLALVLDKGEDIQVKIRGAAYH